MGEVLKVVFGENVFYVLVGATGIVLAVMVGVHNYDYLVLNALRRRMFGAVPDLPPRIDDAIILALLCDLYRNRGAIDAFDIKLIGRP